MRPVSTPPTVFVLQRVAAYMQCQDKKSNNNGSITLQLCTTQMTSTSTSTTTRLPQVHAYGRLASTPDNKDYSMQTA